MASQGDDEYNRALDCIEAGDLAGAMQAAESALMSDSSQGDYWRLYAALLQQAGRNEDAAKAMARGQDLGLDEVDALLMKAGQAAAARQWNKAVSACEDALEIDATRPEVWTSYASSLLEGGYHQDAREASLRATELDGGNSRVWYLRGRVLRLGKDFEGAAHAFEKSVGLDPEFALAWYEKGMVHHEGEEFAAARDCFLKARELKMADPGLDEALRIVEAAMD